MLAAGFWGPLPAQSIQEGGEQREAQQQSLGSPPDRLPEGVEPWIAPSERGLSTNPPASPYSTSLPAKGNLSWTSACLSPDCTIGFFWVWCRALVASRSARNLQMSGGLEELLSSDCCHCPFSFWCSLTPCSGQIYDFFSLPLLFWWKNKQRNQVY